MVCEGNICRSPMAAALLGRELPALDVTSAGTHALVGAPAHAVAAELARAHGIALGAHVATQLDAPLARAADLILTMTKPQREWVEAMFPSTRGKVFRLCDTFGVDVTDPYRRHRTVFDLAFAQIQEGISHWTRSLAGQR
ncbi:low molecular weight protein-tyrosine-phosphatase [Caballeronia novacaledonica]|nr:low molecular weight protein-tyrosine-phosphatase [Caballeronia novacaledonica]